MSLGSWSLCISICSVYVSKEEKKGVVRERDCVQVGDSLLSGWVVSYCVSVKSHRCQTQAVTFMCEYEIRVGWADRERGRGWTGVLLVNDVHLFFGGKSVFGWNVKQAGLGWQFKFSYKSGNMEMKICGRCYMYVILLEIHDNQLPWTKKGIRRHNIKKATVILRSY